MTLAAGTRRRCRDLVMLRWISRCAVAAIEKVIRHTSSVRKGPFFDEALFPWAGQIAACWSAVRAESDALLRARRTVPPLHEVSPAQRVITDDDRWRAFYLFAYGRRVEANCRRCPATAELLEHVPGLTSAFISIMEPGKHVPEHRGPYNGVLRFHFGVQVPPPDGRCRIRVGNETRTWRDGGCLFFDDTFRHEVWNESEQDRVILFVDFLRPLPFPVSLLNRLVLRWLARPSIKNPSLDTLVSWRAPEVER